MAPLKVFLIEDSLLMQSTLSELLDILGGYEVIGGASTESEATEWLHKHRGEWNVATVDLVLQDGSGFNIVRRCREWAPPGTRVVVLSDYVTPSVAQKCRALGADAAFTKGDVEGLAAYFTNLSRDRRVHQPDPESTPGG